MERADLPPGFVAGCPVMLYEAPSGATSWNQSGIAGELKVLKLDGGALALQLLDQLDGRLLLEHKLSKLDDYSFKSQRFHTIRQDRGGHKGLAFSEQEAAKEFKRQLLGLQPAGVAECTSSDLDPCSGCSLVSDDSCQSAAPYCRASGTEDSNGEPSNSGEARSTSKPRRDYPTSQPIDTPSLATVAKAAAAAPLLPRDRGTPLSASPTSTSKTSNFPTKKMSLRDMLRECLCVDTYEEPEFEIGEPFDVKHVGHIGWDTPSFGGENWLDNLMETPGFSEVPGMDFGEGQAQARPDSDYSRARGETVRDSDARQADAPAQPSSDVAEAGSPPRRDWNPDSHQTEESRGEISPAPNPPPEYQDEDEASSQPTRSKQRPKSESGSFFKRLFHKTDHEI